MAPGQLGLEGRIAVVTGAGLGTGRATAVAISSGGGTPSGDVQQDERTAVASLMTRSPLGVPWVEPDDVAPVVVLLAPGAARRVSGTSCAVTAGDSADVTA